MILYENCGRYTPEQRQALMQIPEDDRVLGTYYTFSKRDLEIINKPRREENRLEFAVLRYPGFIHTLYIDTNRFQSIFA